MRFKIMTCGCAGQALEWPGKRMQRAICSLHNNGEPLDPQPNLNGRKAKCVCSGCQSIKDSNPDLGFFKYKPDRPMDEFYCGCRGWE